MVITRKRKHVILSKDAETDLGTPQTEKTRNELSKEKITNKQKASKKLADSLDLEIAEKVNVNQCENGEPSSSTNLKKQFKRISSQKTSSGNNVGLPENASNDKQDSFEDFELQSVCRTAKKVKSKLKLRERENSVKCIVPVTDSGIEKPKSNKTKQNSPAAKTGKTTNSKTALKADINLHTPVSSKQDDSSSESEWEDVAEQESMDLDDYNPTIPKEGVDITIKDPFAKKKRKTNQYDFATYARRELNRFKKNVQLALHKVHLLCLVGHGLYVNCLISSELLSCVAFSLIPVEFLSQKDINQNLSLLLKFVKWYQQEFMYFAKEEDGSEQFCVLSVQERLLNFATTQKAISCTNYCLLFVTMCRSLGFDVRLCIACHPIPFKATDLLTKKRKVECIDISGNDEKIIVEETKKEKSEASKKKPKKKKRPTKKSDSRNKVDVMEEEQVAGASSSNSSYEDSGRKSITRSRRSSQKICYKDENTDTDHLVSDQSDEDFQESDVEVEKKRSSTATTSKKQRKEKPKKVKVESTSSDSDCNSRSNNSKNISGSIDYWAEIYIKDTNKWVCVDTIHDIIDKPHKIEKNLSQSVSYILSFDNENKVKDITWRYASGWMTTVRKLRINDDWWERTLEPFAPPENNEKEKAEKKEMQTAMMEKPLPKTVSEFKDHPLYVLKRHLLKFQALYPQDPPPLGFIRGEEVYARECVRTLHSRETWLKQARSVKVGEQAYKIVKANPKWDKMEMKYRSDIPLNIFGEWQTEKYVPPTAKDGKVPRNEYGNVDLYQPEMVPKGTVHLQLPGLNRVARKLGIDCAQAVTGFETRTYGAGPVFDGFIVCEEFKETLILAWEEEQENIKRRESEKRENRIYGNWKRLIKGLLIREKIKAKYLNTEEASGSSSKK